MITLPSQSTKKWLTSFKGDFFGNLVNMLNLDLFSSQGKVKVGTKMYPHTTEAEVTGITPPSDFVVAQIKDGDGAHPTKTWAVAPGKKIFRSENGAEFVEDTSLGFTSAEDTNSGSDLVHVTDDTGEIIDTNHPIDPTNRDFDIGNESYVYGGTGTFENQAESFTGYSGPLEAVWFDVKKVLNPADDLTLEIQEDVAGVPSGVALTSASIPAWVFSTSYTTRAFPLPVVIQLEADKIYWAVFGRSGARDTTNFCQIRTSLINGFNPTGTFLMSKNNGVWGSPDHTRIFFLSLAINYPAATDRLYLTTSKDVKFLAEENTYWQSLWRGIYGQDPLDDNYPHPMLSLEAGGVLFVADGNKLHSMNATGNNPTDANPNRLVFPSSHFINWMVLTKSAVFIGLQNKMDESLPSMICYYEPYTDVTRIFNIEEGATVGWEQGENCYVIDKAGQMRYYNGTEFKTFDYFPPFYNSQPMNLPHRNGILEKNGIVHFLWKGQYPYAAGIWTYDDGRLYHRYGFIFDRDNLNSFGAIDAPAAIEWRALDASLEGFLAGAAVVDGTLTPVQGIFSGFRPDDGNVLPDNRSHFKTIKFTSSAVDSTWQRVYAKLENTNSIILKYRTSMCPLGEGYDAPGAFAGTWVDSTHFTCASAGFVSGVGDGFIKVGDEVIVRSGLGAGMLAHITAISGTSTKTVTIDSGLAAITTGSFTFSIENWSVMANKGMVGKTSEWMQLKAEIRNPTEVIELQVGSKINRTNEE